MIDAKNALEQARAQAQALQKSIEEGAGKDRAAAQANLRVISGKAHELASGVKQLAGAQRADAQRRLNDAAASLESAATVARNAVDSQAADLSKTNAALFARAAKANHQLSSVLAQNRLAAATART